MTGSGLSFLKTLIKSSLDNYVTPGTLTGTEILLLYMSHWKRNFHVLISAALHLTVELARFNTEEDPSPNEILSECTVECADSTKTTQNALL